MLRKNQLEPNLSMVIIFKPSQSEKCPDKNRFCWYQTKHAEKHTSLGIEVLSNVPIYGTPHRNEFLCQLFRAIR